MQLPLGNNIRSALAAQTLSAPYAGTGDSVGGGVLTPQYLTLAADTSLTSERVFTPGNGLSGVDAGAGSTYTLNLQTPGTLSVSSANSASGSHTHAITSSSNPGAAASLLASDGSGNLTLVGLKANTTTFTLANTTATTVNAFGAATTTNLGPSSGAAVIQPNASYITSLGAIDHKWAQLYAAELVVETLVQQDVIATTGGRVLVGPTTSLIADVAPGDTTFQVKHNNLTNGDRVFLQANGVFEAIAIASGPSVVTGGYQYTITRNLDGWGAQTWHAGDAVFDTGTTGNGFIDLYSQYSVLGLAPDYIFNHDNAGGVSPFESGNYSVNYANSAAWTPFADNANTEVGDSIYFGVAGGTWSNLYFNLTTAAAYSATLVWEFWNGAAWTSFVPSFVGNTNGDFKATGWQGFEWTASSLTSWASKTINSVAAFWVRVRISARTSWTTNPTQNGKRVFRQNGNVGPTIVGWKRNSSTWNDLTAAWAIGNMAGLYGVTASVPGIGLGDFSGGNYLKYDTSAGLALKVGAGNILFDANGITITAATAVTWHQAQAVNFTDGTHLFARFWAAKLSSTLATAIVEANGVGLGMETDVSILSTADNSQNGSVGLSVSNNAGTVTSGLVVQITSGGNAYITMGGNQSGSFVNMTNSLIVAAPTSTTAPTAPLDVRGNGVVTGTLNAGTAGSTDGVIVAMNGQDGVITLRNDHAHTLVYENIRPNSGKGGWLSFTEDSVADRWAIGIKTADATLYFATGNPTSPTTQMTLATGAVLNLANASGKLQVNGTQVVTARQTGWTAPTATLSRTAVANADSLATTISHLAALVTDLTTHGLIGP